MRPDFCAILSRSGLGVSAGRVSMVFVAVSDLHNCNFGAFADALLLACVTNLSNLKRAGSMFEKV